MILLPRQKTNNGLFQWCVLLLYSVGAKQETFCVSQQGVRLKQTSGVAGSVSPQAVQTLSESGAGVAVGARWTATRQLTAARGRAPGARWHRICAVLASFIAGSWVILLPCVKTGWISCRKLFSYYLH